MLADILSMELMLHRLPMNDPTNETRLVSLWGFLRLLVARALYVDPQLIALTRAPPAR